jgi:hypothetical protein
MDRSSLFFDSFSKHKKTIKKSAGRKMRISYISEAFDSLDKKIKCPKKKKFVVMCIFKELHVLIPVFWNWFYQGIHAH